MACLQFFMPTQQKDPSARGQKNSRTRVAYAGTKMLSPIYSLPTWDLCVTQRSLSQITKVDQLLDLKHLTSFGRPLWFISWLNLKSDPSFSVFDIAESKLGCLPEFRCVPILVDKLKNQPRLFSIAIIGCRTAIHLQPSSIEAIGLVADYMALNLFVSDDRSQMYVTYSSEPILAAAASHFYEFSFEKEKRNTTAFNEAIKNVTEAITEGIIDQGKLGELAGRLILLRAMDAAVEKYGCTVSGAKCTGLVTFEQFLRVLLGEKFEKFNQCYKTKNKYDELLKARLGFNHCIQLGVREKDEKYGDKHKQKILENGKRLAATSLDKNHTGTDAEFPIFLPERKDDDISDIKLR